MPFTTPAAFGKECRSRSDCTKRAVNSEMAIILMFLPSGIVSFDHFCALKINNLHTISYVSIQNTESWWNKKDYGF